MAYADQVRGSRRLSIIAGVAAVHGVVGYLFVSGMAMEFATKYVPVLTTTNIPIDVPPPPPEPVPPPMAKTVATPQPTATVPIIDAPASSHVVAVDPGPPTTFTTGTTTMSTEPLAEPSPPPPSLAAGPKVSGSRGAWFTTDDYPPAAIRAEDQGIVAVSLGIGTDGRVTSCAVTQSSGSSALDQATCRLYRSRGRFTAARDAGGTPVTSTYSDRVRWELPPR